MPHILALVASAVIGFGGGGQHAKHVALERWPDHCSPYSIGYRQLPDSLGYVKGGTCRIWLDPDLAAHPFDYRCTLLVHEFAHLAGYHDQRYPPILRRFPPIFKPCVRVSAETARAHRPAITGGWYGGCSAPNPNMPDFPECRF